MKHLVNIDLNQNELQNAVIQVLATDPSGVEGQVYYNSTNNVIRYYDGSSWNDLASGGSVNDATITIAGGNGLTGTAAFTTNQGSNETITLNIGAGSLIDVAADTVSVDLSELTDMTAAMVGTDEFVVLDAGAQRRKAANEINLSTFNNDLTIPADANDATITISGGTGLKTGGAFTTDQASNETITLNLDINGLTATTASAGGDALPIYDASATGERKILLSDIDISNFNNDAGYTAAAAANDATITISAGDGLQTGGDFTTNQGSNETITIDVDSTVVRTSGDQTIAGNKTFSNDVIINGSLDVNGTITTLDTTTLEVGDNEIVLNANVVGVPSLDAGLIVNRGSSTDAKLLWDETADKWSVDNGAGSNSAIATETYANNLVDDYRAATTITTAQSSPYTFTHSLNATAFIAQVYDNTTGEQLVLDITKNGVNAVDVSWNGTLTNNVTINVVKTA